MMIRSGIEPLSAEGDPLHFLLHVVRSSHQAHQAAQQALHAGQLPRPGTPQHAQAHNIHRANAPSPSSRPFISAVKFRRSPFYKPTDRIDGPRPCMGMCAGCFALQFCILALTTGHFQETGFHRAVTRIEFRLDRSHLYKLQLSNAEQALRDTPNSNSSKIPGR